MGGAIHHQFKSWRERLKLKLGYTVVKIKPDRYRRTMEGAIQAILKRAHRFSTVVDVGASNGCWSRTCLKYFPDCQYLLVEAQPVHENALRQMCDRHKNLQFVVKAAGAAAGELFFNAEDPFGGQASYHAYPAHNIRVPVTTVDGEIRDRQLPGPFLIKLDTHGFEIPILKGAAQTLERTEIIVMECYNFKIAPECLLFYEMCQYLAGMGFRCIDLVDAMHRPRDDSFWQMDLVFVKDTRPEFGCLSYQ